MTASATAVDRPRTRAIVALVIGAILTVAGPMLGVLAGGVALIPIALNAAGDTTRVTPSGSVDLDEGEHVLLLAPVADLEHADAALCTAQGPSAGEARVTFEPATALNTRVDGTRYESFARVTAAESGPQAISCDTGIDVVAAPPFELSQAMTPLAWGAVGGIVFSLVGIALVIIGIVRLNRGRRSPSPRR